MNGKNNELKMNLISSSVEIREILMQFSDIIPSLAKGNQFLDEMSIKFSQYGIVVTVQTPEKKIIGFAAFYANDLEKHTGFLSMIGIDKDNQHNGIGAILLTSVERYATYCGMVFLKLEVARSNLLAIKFYKKRGYENVGSTESSIFLVKNITNNS